MADCSYSFPLQGNPQARFSSAKDAILKQGGTVTGSASSGMATVPSPAGTVSFTYQLQGQNLNVQVTDKPWLVSCTKIYDALSTAIAQSPAPAPATTQSTAATKAKAVVTYGPPVLVQSKVEVFPVQQIIGTVPASGTGLRYALLAAAFGVAVVGCGVWWWKRRRST